MELERLLEQGKKTSELLDKFDLNWQVNKVPLITLDGDETDYFGTQRADTKQVFSTCKDSYQVFQNYELANMITEVAGQFDMEVARGGHFKNGARVYLQIHTGDLKGIGENNDTVKKYMTAINSHDGSSSIAFGMSNLTVSCDNMFHKVTRQADMTKIRHSASMRENVDLLMMEFENIREQEKKMYENFQHMAERGVTTPMINNVIATVTGVDLRKQQSEIVDLYSTYQINNAAKLQERITEEMSYKGTTVWGLFSGVTSYTSKDMRVPNRDNGRLESKYTGGALKADNKVYNLLSIV